MSRRMPRMLESVSVPSVRCGSFTWGIAPCARTSSAGRKCALWLIRSGFIRPGAVVEG